MNKKLFIRILTFVLLLCLLAGCRDSTPSGDTVPTAPPETSQPLETPEASPSAQPEVTPTPTPTPDPVPEITPPADEPADPASDTDVIYESETRPPDPASDTDLESD